MVWTAALATLLATSQAQANDDLWQQYSRNLEPAGIDRQMFDTVMLWVEGQYYLGYCDGLFDTAKGVAHYRTWWDDTVLPTTIIGRAIIKSGAEQYQAGLADGRAESPSAELCQRTIDDWVADLADSMPTK